MNFTFSETDGEKPISEWLAVKVKDFALAKYGVELAVKINKPKGQEDKQDKAVR